MQPPCTVVIKDRTALFCGAREGQRGISFCLVSTRVRQEVEEEEEDVGEKKKEERDEGNGRLLGALVKSGEINSLRERRQS